MSTNQKQYQYYDGAIGGWFNTMESMFVPQADNLISGDRYNMGKIQGSKDAEAIISSLTRTGGVITESLKIVSHSMGGAYSKGFVQAIIDYAVKHPELSRGLKISQFDMDPLQAAQLNAIPGVHTEQYTHNAKKKGVKNLNRIADGKQGGLDNAQGKKDGNSYNEDSNKTDHSIMTFINDIGNMQEGKYMLINGKWVLQ
ncbi:hypothetical protein [Pedobacter gandavensis]|uniref:Alpha/beta hydrolase n=1 Tax=Pedobacter gandavensis TaxID=2679963 RepID=A0ABR6EQ70_9SPHI|nr:hypothetical protein [Pedobacter gandavensis]MBB2147396.1 hypothetical protein [Pedobacter gandavensis]